jgi:positive regulator of sigma E activity
MLSASLALYLLPLACMLLVAMLSEQIAHSWSPENLELISMIGGLFGLIAGFLLLMLFSQRRRNDPAYQPVILRDQSIPCSTVKQN